MMNSPLAVPQSPQVKDETEPTDFVGWLQKQLLGGQSVDSLDPAVSSLLTGLLGSNTMGGSDGHSA